MREETETKPKPMVMIGGMPMLWHIMKMYSHYGFKDFVLCLGYRGDAIKQFFLTHELMHNDFTITLGDRNRDVVHGKRCDDENWTITFAETGLKAMTGARIKRIEKYIDGDSFLATYGDAVAQIDLNDLMKFHLKQNTVATLTAVHPHSRWGMIKGGEGGLIGEFVEKPFLYDYVNGGFYVFKKRMFDYLDDDENCVLEREPFTKLVKGRQFSMYRHEKFWHCMDTYRDYLDLNKIWDSGSVPWKVWK